MRTHTSTISLSIILFYIAIIKKTAITISLNRTNSAVDGEQRMTSVEIAELTGKRHKHVMEAIRKMEPAWENVQGSKFRLSQKKLRITDKKGDSISHPTKRTPPSGSFFCVDRVTDRNKREKIW